MLLKDLLFMTSLLEHLSHRAINKFLGYENHDQPSTCRYMKYGEDDHIILNFQDLPEKIEGCTRLIIVSDTHERHQKITNIPVGDIFIHCGDVLMTSRFISVKSGIEKLCYFNEWINNIPCKHKLIIGGNHDNVMEMIGKDKVQSILSNAIYLENSIIEINDLTIYGTPLSSGSSGNTAFQSKTFKKNTIETLPDLHIDILLTHGHCAEVENKVSHSIHLFGHSHSSYGIRIPPEILKGHPVVSLQICVPIMNKYFRPAHLPIVLDIPQLSKSNREIYRLKMSNSIACVSEKEVK